MGHRPCRGSLEEARRHEPTPWFSAAVRRPPPVRTKSRRGDPEFGTRCARLDVIGFATEEVTPMQSRSSRVAFAVLSLACAVIGRTGHAAVVINPTSWGLSPGDTFRLVVVTAGGTTATSPLIAAYDSFVNSQGLSGITYSGSSLSWQAIGMTPSSNPVSDNSRYSSLANTTRVFNLNGVQVSSTTNGTAFWKTSGFNQHLAAIDWTINGSGNLAQVGGFQNVWTGYDIDGAKATQTNYDSQGFPQGSVDAVLGQTANYNGWDFINRQQVPSTLYPLVGRTGASANGWSAADNLPLATNLPLYAISDVITVTAVPEPSGLAVVAVGLAAAAGITARRRFAAARLRRAPPRRPRPR